MNETDVQTSLAVVGMAGRFPGARNLEEYWKNLREGVESIREYSDEELREAGVDPSLLDDPDYVKAGAPLEEMEMFDAGFFGLSPRDASIMDPQHRHFLECAWAAMEHAGHMPSRFDGAVGVFAGSGTNAYLWSNLLTNPDLAEDVGFFLLRHTGNDKDFLSTRVSYEYDLRGPSVNVQTACSTSLVAVHLAGQSLLSGECDLALAGGATIEQPHRAGYMYEEGEILSPDGHCRAFDADAEGTVFGSGVGVVVLKRLEDALDDGDTVHAVVRGSAVNNDGSEKVGYLAPSVEGQTRAVAEALAISGVHPDTVDYVEAHGTGTPVGDPIEVTALTEAFRTKTNRTGYCGLGSVKTNIGHLDTAAGIASFIKAVLALKHREVPPTLHFEEPNPELELDDSPFYVADERTEWTSDESPRRAGVSSLGVGGTNAHVILEEAPGVPETSESRDRQLLVLSAKTRSALERATSDLTSRLETDDDTKLPDAAYTLQTGRERFEHRQSLVCGDREEALNLLLAPDSDRVETVHDPADERPVAFLFAGGGAQHRGMGRTLYESEPVYRETLDRCLELLEPHVDEDLRPLLFPEDGSGGEPERLERPEVALPALFATQYAQAKLWSSWGVEPEAMIGHSMGEYTAACLAGVLSLEDALRLVAVRGRLFSELPPGGMISVPLAEEELRGHLGDELSVAAVNAPELSVASGPVDAVDRLEAELSARDVDVTRIHIDVAAHSSMLDPILDEFREKVRDVDLRPPELPFASNLSGDWITAEQATDPEYWVRQLRETVRFADGMQSLLESPDRALVEVGPGRTLATLAGLQPDKEASQPALPSMPHPQDRILDHRFMLESLGKLWSRGVDVDWDAFYAREERRRVPLPTYPFEHEPHWVEPGEGAGAPAVQPDADGRAADHADLENWFYEPSWRRQRLQPPAPSGDGARRRAVIFRDGTGLADALAARLEESGREVVSVERAEEYARVDENRFTLDPGDPDDYARLLDDLSDESAPATDVFWLWTVGGDAQVPDSPVGGDIGAAETEAFFGPIRLAKAIGRNELPAGSGLTFVSTGTLDVSGGDRLRPERSLLLGPAQVLDREFPELSTRIVDVDDPTAGGAGPARIVDQLVAEARSDSGDRVVAYRGPDRWVRSFERLPLGDAADGAAFRDGGVYLVTGGLGGLGLALARRVAEEVPGVRLVLASRSGLPPREQWDRHLRQDGTGRTGDGIGAVREMEAAGAEVTAAAADVTDPEATRALLQDIDSRYGRLDGIVHAAGVLDDGLVELKDEESLRSVLAPKVRGTLNLWDAAEGADLDFLALYSSVSALAGLPSQVDYTSANAFLDAFARDRARRGDDPYVVSVAWGPWSEVGMASRLASGDGSGTSGEAPGQDDAGPESGDVVEELDSPLLDCRMARADGRQSFVTQATPDRLWMLDEHRVRNGPIVMPGSGFVALAREAVSRSVGPGGVELHDVYFIAPFVLHEDEEREIRVEVEEEDGAGSFVISARPADGGAWTEHARGRFSTSLPARGQATDPRQLRERCRDRVEEFEGTEYHRHLNLGPRWEALRRVEYGEGEAVTTIELPDECSDDLTSHPVHPALLDVATAGAQALIPDFDREEDFFVPVSYGSIALHEALPGRLFSHVRYRPEESDGDDMAVFDVTLVDESGSPVAEIDEFMMMRVRDEDGAFSGDGSESDGSATESSASSDEAGEPPAPDSSDRAGDDDAGPSDGIDTDSGVEALFRILDHRPAPRVVVYPEEPTSLFEEPDEAESPEDSDDGTADRPDVDVSPVESALEEHPAVAEAAAAAFPDQPGEVRVVAWVAYAPGEHTTVSVLRRYLRDQLPDDLLPRNFVELDALPRTDDGDVARDELDDPFGPVDDHVEPRTETEETVAEIWQDLLGVDRVGAHDNFLDIGGHSLLAVRALRRMESATGVELNPLVMTLNTLEQIASQIDEESVGGPGGDGAGSDEREAATTEGVDGEESSRGFLSSFRSVLGGSES